MKPSILLIFNLLLPGSGTLIKKKFIRGILQLLGAFAGFLIMGISLMSGRLVGNTDYELHLLIGAVIFIISYIWSLVDGILFLKNIQYPLGRRN